MSTTSDNKRIVRDPDVYSGKPCIEGYRIAVHDIAVSHAQGYTPEQMVADLYPTLTLPEVYAARSTTTSTRMRSTARSPRMRLKSRPELLPMYRRSRNGFVRP